MVYTEQTPKRDGKTLEEKKKSSYPKEIESKNPKWRHSQ